MDNLFLIASKQLRSADFSGYVVGVLQGNFNSLITNYVQGGGYLGNNVLYLTGSQTILGDKLSLGNLQVQYSGTTGSAPSQQFVLDQNTNIQTQINSLNLYTIAAAHLTGVERFLNNKFFEQIIINSGQVSGELMVPNPVNSGDAVPLGYLQSQINTLLNSNLLNTSGVNQNVSGSVIFINEDSLYLPISTNMSGGISLTQLDMTGNYFLNQLSNSGLVLQSQINNLQAELDSFDPSEFAGMTGFAGVSTFNGQSGNIFTQGRGSVTCYQQGNVFNVSGVTPNFDTGSFLGYLNIPSGVSNLFVNYGQNYSTAPFAFAQLVNPSGDPILNSYVSQTTSGFNVIFSNNIPTNNYSLNYFGFTGSGSFIQTIQGPQGAPSLISITPYVFNYYTNNFITGSGVFEQLIPQNITITGISISARITGIAGITSGNIYTVDNLSPTIQTQTNLTGFVLHAGNFSSQVNCYNNPLFAFNPNGTTRIGIDILTGSTGMNKVCIGIFGYGT